MSDDTPTPPDDGFPQGRATDMQDILLSPPTGAKPAGRWEPPTAEELQKLLPQYEITALLGRGGMGAVYKGTQIALDRPVAIKILSNQLEEADTSFAERFKNEAKAMAKLSHPGIVGVFDFGEAASGLLYIVMEFIEGTDVARMIAKQSRLHTEHAMAITAHVCDALAYAHERGIIHRDIKPANIMVGYDGVVKVADFGLAKMTQGQNSGLTQSGMAMGTLHYMAPETLMLGTAVDHRADIYAVGVMLYQMLTGKIPQGLFELPSLQVPGLDPRYDAVIGKALREDREVRYPSIRNMRHDLDAILTQPVVKVEASAEKAPAALPTMARPQRPGAGQKPRPDYSRPLSPRLRKTRGSHWGAIMLGLVMVCGLAFCFQEKLSFMGKSRPPESSKPPEPVVVAKSPPPLSAEPVGETANNPVKSAPPQSKPTTHKQVVTSAQFELRWNSDAIAENAVRAMLQAWDAGAVGMQELVGTGPLRPGPVFVIVEVGPESLPRVGFTSYLPKAGNDIGISPSRLQEVVSLHEKNQGIWSTIFHVITEAYTMKAEAKFSRISRTKTGGAIIFGLRTVARHASWRRDMLEKVAAPMGSGGPLQTLAAEKGKMENLVSVFEAATDTSWKDAMDKGQGTSFSPGSVHLFAGILMRLAAEHEDRSFLQRLFTMEIPAMPDISSESQALEEMANACSRAAGRELRSEFIRRWRWPLSASDRPAAALPSGPTIWTDTQGRSITATFKAIAGGNVLLDIAGKVTPVPLNTLAAESQKLARNFDDSRRPPARDDLAEVTKDVPFVNTLGMKFVPVPGTRVLFCVHETRYRDYAAYAKENAETAAFWMQQEHDGFKLRDNGQDHPVVNVNLAESQGFCQWLSQKEEKAYRLPTDTEWSAAAGVAEAEQRSAGAFPSEVAIKQLGFPWGNSWPPPPGSGNYSDESRRRTGRGRFYIVSYDDGYPTTAPVMSFSPNNLGIYDLGGNVWEWCRDRFHSAGEEMGLRGGSWHDGQEGAIRLSRRTLYLPEQRNAGNGFRCVIELEDITSTVKKGDAVESSSATPSPATNASKLSRSLMGPVTVAGANDIPEACVLYPAFWSHDL